MTLTPNEIAANLVQLTRDLDALVREYRGLGSKAAEAKRASEVAYARAYLGTAGPVEERKQRALFEAAEQRFQADVAAHEVSACKEAIRAIGARIDVGRTLSATTRDEMKTLGVAT